MLQTCVILASHAPTNVSHSARNSHRAHNAKVALCNRVPANAHLSLFDQKRSITLTTRSGFRKTSGYSTLLRLPLRHLTPGEKTKSARKCAFLGQQFRHVECLSSAKSQSKRKSLRSSHQKKPANRDLCETSATESTTRFQQSRLEALTTTTKNVLPKVEGCRLAAHKSSLFDALPNDQYRPPTKRSLKCIAKTSSGSERPNKSFNRDK